MYNRYMVITNSTGIMNNTTVVSPKSIKNPKPPKSPRSPRKRSPRKHKKDILMYLPKDDEELFKHLYPPHFITEESEDNNTDTSTSTELTLEDDDELVRRLFPWLLEN